MQLEMKNTKKRAHDLASSPQKISKSRFTKENTNNNNEKEKLGTNDACEEVVDNEQTDSPNILDDTQENSNNHQFRLSLPPTPEQNILSQSNQNNNPATNHQNRSKKLPTKQQTSNSPVSPATVIPDSFSTATNNHKKQDDLQSESNMSSESNWSSESDSQEEFNTPNEENSTQESDGTDEPDNNKAFEKRRMKLLIEECKKTSWLKDRMISKQTKEEFKILYAKYGKGEYPIYCILNIGWIAQENNVPYLQVRFDDTQQTVMFLPITNFHADFVENYLKHLQRDFNQKRDAEKITFVRPVALFAFNLDTNHGQLSKTKKKTMTTTAENQTIGEVTASNWLQYKLNMTELLKKDPISQLSFFAFMQKHPEFNNPQLCSACRNFGNLIRCTTCAVHLCKGCRDRLKHAKISNETSKHASDSEELDESYCCAKCTEQIPYKYENNLNNILVVIKFYCYDSETFHASVTIDLDFIQQSNTVFLGFSFLFFPLPMDSKFSNFDLASKWLSKASSLLGDKLTNVLILMETHSDEWGNLDLPKQSLSSCFSTVRSEDAVRQLSQFAFRSQKICKDKSPNIQYGFVMLSCRAEEGNLTTYYQQYEIPFLITKNVTNIFNTRMFCLQLIQKLTAPGNVTKITELFRESTLKTVFGTHQIVDNLGFSCYSGTESENAKDKQDSVELSEVEMKPLKLKKGGTSQQQRKLGVYKLNSTQTEQIKKIFAEFPAEEKLGHKLANAKKITSLLETNHKKLFNYYLGSVENKQVLEKRISRLI